jgi:uncharacterized membrane protein YidH (DUF202 family)
MRAIGILLVIGGLLLGYFGYEKYNENKANIKIGDLELTAKDKNNTTIAYIMMGGAVVALIVGAVVLSRKSN